MITSRLSSGLPRPFCELNENRRCSILFHLLVPGGKWQTWIVSPVVSARRCWTYYQRVPRFVLIAVGAWLGLSALLAALTSRVAVWYLMTDELLYERLAISIAQGRSPLPRVHGELVASLNQLYPLVIAPAFAQDSVTAALRDAHVLNAFLMASVSIPVLLLTRRITQSDRVAYLVAVLSVLVPWIVYASFLLTEVVAYPVFVWALLALQRATVTPRARNDLLALGAIALAILARTQFTILLVVLPAAIVLHELAFTDGGSRRERLRLALRGAAARHRPLVAACAVLILVVGGLAATGRLSDALGTYSATLKGNLIPSGIGRSFTEHVATLALGLGVLPFVIGVAWLLGGLAVSRTKEQQAFASIGVLTIVLLTLEVTTFDLRFAEGFVLDRYLFGLAPIVLIGFGAALVDRGWPRWSLLWPTAIVLVGFALMPLRFFETLNVDTPVSALDDALVSFAGSKGGARVLLVAGTAVVVVLFLQASLLLRRRSVVIGVAALALAASFAQTGNSFARLFGGDEAAGRPLTGDQGTRLGWIDATLGSDADVTMIPYPLILYTSYSKSLEFAWDTEFWNMSVRHTAVDANGAFSWTPTGTFPTTELRFDDTTGRANVTVSAHAVSSERDARFRLAGRTLKVVQSTALIETEQPWRADWISRGLTDDGWTLPGTPGAIRVFAKPGQRGRVKRYVTFQVRAPAGVEARPFTVRSNMDTWTAKADAGFTVQGQLQVCAPAGGYSDIQVNTAERSQTHGDPIDGFLYALTPREVGVGFLQVALADEVVPGCAKD